MEKMTSTIFYLKEASEKLLQAAARLEKQDAWHQEQALALINLANEEIQRTKRQIDRAIEQRTKDIK